MPKEFDIWDYFGNSKFPLLRIAIPLITGMAFYEQLYWRFSIFLLLFLAPFILLFILYKKNLQFQITLLLFCLIFGSVWRKNNPHSNKENLYTNYIEENKNQKIALKILNQGEKKEKSYAYKVRVLGVKKNNNWIATQGNAIMYYLEKENKNPLLFGDTIIIDTRFQEFNNAITPYHFDYKKYMQAQGFSHQIFLYPKAILRHQESNIKEPIIIKIRNKIHFILTESIEDKTSLSLVQAVILNDRTNMSSELRNHFSKTGVAHIIAISGMHVSILCGFLLVLLPYIRNQKLEYALQVLAIILVWFYVYLTDFPPSAIRACLMFTLSSISLFLNRTGYSINNLFLTAILMLLFNPVWLEDLGFQLSFLAVLSILLFQNSIQNLWKPSNKVFKYLWEIISVSFSVQILVLPLILYYFNNIPIFVILANIPAVIYSFLLLSGSFILIIFYFIAPIISICIAQALSFITKYFYLSIQSFSTYTPKGFQSIVIDILQMSLLYLIIISLILALISKQRKYWIISYGILLVFFTDYNYKEEKKKTEDFIYIKENKGTLEIFIKHQISGFTIYSEEDNPNFENYDVSPFLKAYSIKNYHISNWNKWDKISISELEKENNNARFIVIENTNFDLNAINDVFLILHLPYSNEKTHLIEKLQNENITYHDLKKSPIILPYQKNFDLIKQNYLYP